jgi:dienelactone hydrolase
VAAVRTRAEAAARQAIVKRRMLESIGGLPEYTGPLRARVTGRLTAPGYAIEKVIYESLPGVYVTGNVYVPGTVGRWPAILATSGHTQEGKPEPQVLAANLALQGYVVLTFDPIGQGEREQTYLPQLGRPLSGGGGNEHLELGARSILMGASVARYFIHDAMRGIDYLTSRTDVDGERIGVTGCSGGGAIAAYVAALDRRVKAAAAGCFINSFRTLFTGPTADSEMSLPRLLANGLDWADVFELAAPTPWLMMATEEDYFPPAGAEAVYRETKKFYGHFSASNRVSYFVGPGPHGTPWESREKIYHWMNTWLRNGERETKGRRVKEFTNHELRVTATGNVDGEPGSRKMWEVIREEFAAKRRSAARGELRAEMQQLGVRRYEPAPPVQVLEQKLDRGYRMERIRIVSEPGVEVEGRLYVPWGKPRGDSVLVVEDQRVPVPLYVQRSPSTEGIVVDLLERDVPVLELAVRDSPDELDGRPFLGNWKTNVRADLVGRNLAAMRAGDLLAGAAFLRERFGGEVKGYARGVKGFWLLLAAAGGRGAFQRLLLDRMPRNWRSVYESPMSHLLFEAIVPGFALRWDVEDLEAEIGRERVLRSDPANWMNVVVYRDDGAYYRRVGEANDRVLELLLAGTAGGIP